MAREYMCRFNNCTETDCPFALTLKSWGKKHFCSLMHAIAWAVNYAAMQQNCSITQVLSDLEVKIGTRKGN